MKPVADITGGNVLRIPAIRSPNYVANVSGWTINQDGSAQFNSATFIGSITITNGNELVIYSTATPQLGSIVMALSPGAGSDSAGNFWGPGFTLFDGTTGATMVNFGANVGFTFANPTNILGTHLLLSNVPLWIVSSSTPGADASMIQGVHGAVYATTETLELMASTATLATDAHQSQVVQKITESNGLDAADMRFDFVSTAGTSTLLKLVNGQVSIPTAFVVGGKSTFDEQISISTADTNGALFIFQSVPTTGNPGTISHSESAAGNGAYAVFVNGDAHSRFVWDSNGKHRWGPGNAGLDTALERTAAGILAVSTGSFAVTTIGQGLQVKEGTNAKQGTAVLVAGTVTVNNTSVTANSRIFLTAQNTGGTPGALRISARVAGTSFTITSTSAADTSTVAYEIIEPA